MENLKMISEFMEGYDFQHTEGGLPLGDFSNSWEWLMPVVKECFDNGAEGDEIGDITHALLDCDRDATYEAVVKFLNRLKPIKMRKNETLREANRRVAAYKLNNPLSVEQIMNTSMVEYYTALQERFFKEVLEESDNWVYDFGDTVNGENITCDCIVDGENITIMSPHRDIPTRFAKIDKSLPFLDREIHFQRNYSSEYLDASITDVGDYHSDVYFGSGLHTEIIIYTVTYKGSKRV